MVSAAVPPKDARTVVGDVVAGNSWTDPNSQGLEWLARLLLSEGVDLLSATACDLARGTPVYVDARACALEVQRIMAINLIRSVPVVDAGRVIGMIDLVDLALRDDLGA
jgi:CBS domain-containing protein